MNNESSLTNNRITWIDMAKGYGIIAVFIGHMVQFTMVGDFVYSFHLPLFFFISGYLFKKSDSFSAFLKKKARGILLPYFTLGIPVMICSALFPLFFQRHYFTINTVIRALSENIIEYLFQFRYTTLWYLAVLFGINIAMFVLCKINNHIAQGVIVVAAFIGIMYYYQVGGGELPWNIDVVFAAMIFFWVGYIFKNRNIIEGRLAKVRFMPLWSIAFLIINILFTILSFKFGGSGLEMYRCEYGFIPFTVISAFAGIMFVITLSLMTTLRPLLYIGRNSLVYFLWHQAIVYPVIDFFIRLVGIEDHTTSFGLLTSVITIKLVITCVILWACVEIMRHTPLKIFVR